MTVSAVELDDLPIPPRLLVAFRQSSHCASLALVGGAVRDLLLHRVHQDPLGRIPDLDLVVEPIAGVDPADPRPAAHRLAENMLEGSEDGVRFCHFHRAYGTVEMEIDGVLLDLATARCETYPAPGENPRVRFGSLQDDLARRDFSINAMALVLTPEGRALTFLDPHGGALDLASRQLRLLHDRSLEDDPTRILRAARYSSRMGFRLAATSLEQLRTTLARWPWADGRGTLPAPLRGPPSLGPRLRMEMELLLEREPWRRALALLQEWGALVLIDPALQSDTSWLRRLLWADRLGLPRMAALLAAAADPEAVAARLQLPHGQQRLLAQLGRVRLAWQARKAEAGQTLASERAWTPSQWCGFLEQPGWSPDAIALALVSGALPRRPLLRWWCRWRHVRSPVEAAELIAQGVAPGPLLGQRLRLLRAERLEGERF